MKKLFLPALLFATLFAMGQQNVFLDRGYWKSQPSVEMIKKDAAAGNDLVTPNERGYDATATAILGGASLETIEFLMGYEGNGVNKLTHDGRTYIFWAASSGQDALVDALIKMGADTKLRDGHNNTPFLFAASAGNKNLSVFEVLLNNDKDCIKDVDEHGANALLLAIAADKEFKVTEYLISKGLSLKSKDEEGSTAFDYAAKTGDINHLEKLKKKGVSPTNQAIIYAAQGTRGSANKLETFQYLKGLGLKPSAVDAHGNNALHFLARKKDQADIIQWFITNGANPSLANHDGITPVFNAVSGNEMSVISIFLDKTKDINATDKKGATLLAYALKNKPQVVQGLIAKGAKTDLKDNLGDNLALYLINSYNPKDAESFDKKLSILTQAGFNISDVAPNGNTALHYAVTKNDLSLIKQLNLKNLDVNAKNQDGLTALHKAAMIGKDDSILTFLLNAGADKSIKTDMGETAYDLATENETFIKKNISINFLK